MTGRPNGGAEKTPNLEGVLWGIKGQYLILDIGMINIRKYAGYESFVGVDLNELTPFHAKT